MRVVVVDHHPIFRRGLSAWLSSLPEVSSVAEADPAQAAGRLFGPQPADVLLVDSAGPGGLALVRRAAGAGIAILVCTRRCWEPTIIAAMRLGASGYLLKGLLTPDQLRTALAAIATGTSLLGPGVLGPAAAGSRSAGARPDARALTERERGVLALIAEGVPTHEIARRLSFSERTIKTVLQRVTLKLDARTRTQAVALAVRDGLI